MIGCGLCIDFFVFEVYFKIYKLYKKIEYYGFEKNMFWKDIYDFIIKYGKKYNLLRFRIIYIDVMSEV